MIRSYKDRTPSIHPGAFISEAAYVVGDVEIGENTSVWPGAVIRADFGKITIGRNTAIEDNCVIHTGVSLRIGDNVIVGHGATVHCSSVGDNCLVGIGAILLEGAEIGNDCLIAAGALVTPNSKIPDGSLVMGSPARVQRKVTGERLEMLRLGSESYLAIAQEYKKSGL
jgi:carbonic anhydrase/acetyltransferase-like protein (isoleucine patch superfamily)